MYVLIIPDTVIGKQALNVETSRLYLFLRNKLQAKKFFINFESQFIQDGNNSG